MQLTLFPFGLNFSQSTITKKYALILSIHSQFKIAYSDIVWPTLFTYIFSFTISKIISFICFLFLIWFLNAFIIMTKWKNAAISALCRRLLEALDEKIPKWTRTGDTNNQFEHWRGAFYWRVDFEFSEDFPSFFAHARSKFISLIQLIASLQVLNQL